MGEYEKNSNTAPRERSLPNLFFMKAPTFQMLKKEAKNNNKKLPYSTFNNKLQENKTVNLKLELEIFVYSLPRFNPTSFHVR